MGENTAVQLDPADRFAADPAFAVHLGGKLAVRSTRSIDSIADLALTYTPGVARVSSAIAAEPELGRRFTWAPRVVAVVSDGSAVLGLGDIGPVASLPVMEGKACLFAEFAGLSAAPAAPLGSVRGPAPPTGWRSGGGAGRAAGPPFRGAVSTSRTSAPPGAS